ncbi:MAG: NAD(P)/FAD-dependent oxidoreductase [Candidatus Nanoarchaeia archaeon]
MENKSFEGKKAIIIGGGSAGTTAAFELRKLNKEIAITIIEQTRYTEYSPCALPYVIGREIYVPEKIFIYKPEDYSNNNINLMTRTLVQSIDTKEKLVKILEEDRIVELKYDFLIIATGAVNNAPRIQGLESLKFLSLKTIDDAREIMADRGRRIIIIGGGLIGVEVAGTLSRDRQVTIIESTTILNTMLDKEMSERVKQYLEGAGITIREGTTVDRVEEGKLFIGSDILRFDTLIITAGMKPNTEMAKEAGLKTAKGIIVDKNLKTSDKNIYACGDVIEYASGIHGKNIISMLGSTAVKQAKIIAANILGDEKHYSPVFSPTISKTKDIVIGSTGITEAQAEKHGIKTVSAIINASTKAEYYPFGKQITVKLISDYEGNILGAQILGQEEVAGRINTITMALQKRATVEDLCNLETVYNPAIAPVFDPIVIAAEACRKKLKYLAKTKKPEKKFFLGFKKKMK